VTICTYLNQSLFGEILNQKMILNEIGLIVESEWKRTEHFRKEVTLDDFIVMPNHLYGMVIIDYVSDHVGAPGACPRFPTRVAPLPGISESQGGRAPLYRNPGSLGSIIAGFKSSATKQINIFRGTPGKPVWQRGFFDRIIRNEEELNRIRDYIRTNPDRFKKNPADI
jgi:REP element-mobilizing transposase RayT